MSAPNVSLEFDQTQGSTVINSDQLLLTTMINKDQLLQYCYEFT